MLYSGVPVYTPNTTERLPWLREETCFTSGGICCAAWVYRPLHGPGGRRAAVVLGAGLGGTRETGLTPYAERFAAAGMVALVFDYRHFGSSSGYPRQVVSLRRQLVDWHAAVAAARARPDVDPNRVGLWGVSLSGGSVLQVAAADPQVAAVVAQVPFVAGPSSVAAMRPFPRQQLLLAWCGLCDVMRAAAGRDPCYVPVVGPPGALAMLTSPDAEPGYRAIAPADWDNRVAARVALAVSLAQPGRAARHVRCPVFLAAADRDEVVPVRATLAAFSDAADALGRDNKIELHRYPLGHFDPFVPPAFDDVVADEETFLLRELAPPPPQPVESQSWGVSLRF